MSANPDDKLTMAMELKPCPFCNATLERIGSDYQHPDNECIEASLSFPPTLENIAAWNRRVEPSPSAERMREALRAIKIRARNARGAIESNQVGDKDVHGSMNWIMQTVDAALTNHSTQGDGK